MGISPSFTSPKETFHIRSAEMSVTLQPNEHESMSCRTQYFRSDQVLALDYGMSIRHVSNEISSTAWYNQLANTRYNKLATKRQQTKKCNNRFSHKNCNATLYYNAAQYWQIRMKQIDGLWSRSSSPSNFVWLQLELKPKTFRLWTQNRSVNSGSACTAPVSLGQVSYLIARPVWFAVCAHNYPCMHGRRKGGGKGGLGTPGFWHLENVFLLVSSC